MNYLKALSILILLSSTLAYSEDYKEVSWDDLMPADWVPPVSQEQDLFELEESIANLDFSAKTEFAPIVKALDKQKLKLPGYMIPIKFTASSVSEFLLVPYMGACIHTPPPPENQIVYVTLKKPIETSDMWEPVWVSGVMKAQISMTDIATAGYHLTDAVTEKYEY